MLRLVVRYRRETLVFPLPEAEVTLGSSSKAALVVPFSGVSRLHARVAPTTDGIRIADAGSKNGVISSGERVPRATVLLGESVRLGDATLSVEEAAEADDLALRLDDSTAPAASRSVSTLSGPLDAPASALRLVREMEGPAPDAPIRRRRLLQKARAILDAESIFALDPAGAAEPAVLESDGPLPDLGTLVAISSAARPRTSAHRPVCVHIPPDRVAVSARASSASDAPILVAMLASRPGSDVPWKRELLAFLANRLLEGGSAADAPSSPAPPPPLRLPDGLVTGTSAAFSGLLASIEATVGSGLDILLTGETGTGKELVARTIHALSARTGRPPSSSSTAAAIPDDLVEARAL
jgi:pSer/pThr/pTyr-binding forkhead associated (FHA) protein